MPAGCTGTPHGRRVVATSSTKDSPIFHELSSLFARGFRSSITRSSHGRSDDSGIAPEAGVPEERRDAVRELAGRQPHHLLLVEPIELVGIEDRVSAADALERETVHELRLREELLVRPGRPSKQREEIDHRLGKIPKPLVLRHRRRAMTFAQALLVGAEDERHVGELRDRGSERLEEEHVLRRVRDVIVAPHDMRDLHVHVVGDD